MSDMDMGNFKSAAWSPAKKSKALNPNAAEFVPSLFQSVSVGLDVDGTSGSVISEASDPSKEDEAHLHWLQKLPDDITPDFGSDDGSKLLEDISVSGLLLHKDVGPSQHAMSRDFLLSSEMQATSPQGTNFSRGNEFSGHNDLCYPGRSLSFDAVSSACKLWDKQYSVETNSWEGSLSDENLEASFLTDILDKSASLNHASVDPVDFLSSNFPGFASESLADVYYASGCDLTMTVEILTQLELQVDDGFNTKLISKTPSTPSFSSLDFPSLSVSDEENNLTNYNSYNVRQSSGRNQSIINKENFCIDYSSSLKSTQDFASAVRKYAPADTSKWQPERDGSLDKVIGSRRGPVHHSASCVAQGKSISADKIQGNNGRETPVWLETGDAVGNLYTESRQEARDLARIRNACFDQARQAYLVGNKALAKELSLKGKLYGMHMAAAHEKAREMIYKQRNPVSPAIQGYYRGKELMIDLHGLHVSEAIHVLRHELSIMRKTAKSTGQHLQVLVCVGTGHHTKGLRSPARLPVAVEKYLLDERLQFSESQPGLFRVVIQ